MRYLQTPTSHFHDTKTTTSSRSWLPSTKIVNTTARYIPDTKMPILSARHTPRTDILNHNTSIIYIYIYIYIDIQIDARLRTQLMKISAAPFSVTCCIRGERSTQFSCESERTDSKASLISLFAISASALRRVVRSDARLLGESESWCRSWRRSCRRSWCRSWRSSPSATNLSRRPRRKCQTHKDISHAS